jgi:hypothetical protein
MIFMEPDFSPGNFARGLGTSPITASEVTDFPDPDSPTIPSV